MALHPGCSIAQSCSIINSIKKNVSSALSKLVSFIDLLLIGNARLVLLKSTNAYCIPSVQLHRA